MNRECVAFRALLEHVLASSADPAGPVEPLGLTQLGWHEHLLGCGECREVLEAEEALEVLLASLPEPKLPPELARRVLERLRLVRGERRLDELLALDRGPQPPGDLAARVLAGVAAGAGPDARLAASSAASGRASDEERLLDELLDRAGAVDVPLGLASRVLAAVEVERVAGRAPAGRRRPLVLRSPLLLAAATLMVALTAALWWRLSRPEQEQDGAQVARATNDPGPATATADDVEPELLDALVVLENWELLNEIDSLALDAITVFGPSDEALLEVVAAVDDDSNG